MARRAIAVDNLSYLFSPDDERSEGERFRALLRARVIDELTAMPPRSQTKLDTDAAHAVPRIGQDGLVGAAGIPRQVLHPRSIPNYLIRLTLRCDGYQPRYVEAQIADDRRSIGAPAPVQTDTMITLNDATRLRPGELLLIGTPGPGMVAVKIEALGPAVNQLAVSAEISTGKRGLPRAYAVGAPVFPIVPADFAPTDLGELRLHREPTVIAGRTVRVSGNTTTPLAGAAIRIKGIWRVIPSATVSVPADPPNLIALNSPLYAERPAGAGRLNRRNLPPIPDLPPQEKRLLVNVAAGESSLRLTNRIGLSLLPNPSILLIDVENPDRREYIAINTIEGGSNPAEPSMVGLSHPLAFAHGRNALAQRTNPQAAGSQKFFSIDPNPGEPDALAGDTTVFLNDLSGLTGGNQVQVSGGPSAEFHQLQLFAAVSDVDGYYRLPPLSRVAQLEIRAQHGALSPIELEFRPDYGLRENRLDLVFR